MSDDQRMVLERIAQLMADGLDAAMGQGVELGLHGHFDDHEVTNRPLPVRALVVEFSGGLSDCIIGLTSMREEPARSAVTAAALEIAKGFGVDADITPPVAHEFAERDDALEQLEALVGEPTVHFVTPVGDMLIIVGSGLVSAVDHVLNPPRMSASASVGDEFTELGYITDVPVAQDPVYASSNPLAARSAGDPSAQSSTGDGGDWFGVDAPGPAGAYQRTAAENAAAAALSEGAQRWSSLLSGVEVEISAELGRTSMPLGDVASLVAESVLTLDQVVDEPIRVFVNGAPYATARLVVVDGEYGIEIVDVMESAALRERIAA